MSPLNLDQVRGAFPAICSPAVFLDNARGSQVVKPVAHKIAGYMFTAKVQLGAVYGTFVAAGKKVTEGRAALPAPLNADRPEEVVMGATATQLLNQLAQALVRYWKPRDQIIVTNFEHETNIGPWLLLRQRDIKIKTQKLPEGEHRPTQERSNRFSCREHGSVR